MSVWISDEKLLIFASLISPSKMILFEKKYQTFDTVFHHQMKHCVSCLIYYVTVNNSRTQDYVHADNRTQPTYEVTPGFKPFTVLFWVAKSKCRGKGSTICFIRSSCIFLY